MVTICGRSVVPNSRTYEELAHKYGATRVLITPDATDKVVVPGDNIHVLFDWKGETCFVAMHWGFRGVELYNARSDSLTKPTWRGPYENNRCVFLTQSFTEGTRSFSAPVDAPSQELCIAGIYGVTPKSHVFCVSLVTAPANAAVAPVHNRMPLLMPEEGVLDWISPRYHTKAAPLLGEFTEYSKDVELTSRAAEMSART